MARINGDINDNLLFGTSGDDEIYGDFGNDRMDGGGGNDKFILKGGQGKDSFIGGDGDDKISVEDVPSYYIFTAIQISFMVEIESIENNSAKPADIYANGLLDLTKVNLYNIRSIYGSDSADTIYAGEYIGTNLDVNPTTRATISGNGGNDAIYGSYRAETLDGGDGDDYIYGGGGSDTIKGGAGYDIVKLDGDESEWNINEISWTATRGSEIIKLVSIEEVRFDSGNPNYSVHAPTAIVDTDSITNEISEKAVNGTVVGITAFSSDPDGGSITYSLANNAGGAFAIDPTTGVVTVADASKLDYEAGASRQIVVAASDGYESTTATFTINLLDANDAPALPVDGIAAANSVAEGAATGTVVGVTAVAADPDAGAVVVYSLVDDAGGRFAIDPATGVVTVADGSLLDYETAQSHQITVAASDGEYVSQKSFTIAVTNVSDNPTWIGTSGNDTFTASNADNWTLSGGEGDDILTGNSGNDVLAGNAGNDTLNGGAAGDDVFVFSGQDGGFDAVTGGAGTDTIKATADNTIIGLRSIATVEAITADGHANVSISGDTASNSLYLRGVTLTGITQINMGAGADSVTGSAAADMISGDADDDNLSGEDGDDVFLFSGVGNGFDAITGGNGTDTIKAVSDNTVIGLKSVYTTEMITADGHANVTISGSVAADTLNFATTTLDGIVRINGGAGNDTITGSAVADVISGDADDDTLNGGAGDDRFQFAGSGDGFDAITGGAGTDVVEATADGTIIGLKSINTIEVISANGFANVSVFGSASADSLNFAGVTLTGIAGVDGGAGNDTLDFTTAILAQTAPIRGGTGSDTIRGSAAGDQLFGGADSDTLYGQGGNDLLVGGQGDDTIDGGDGDDIVEFGAGDGFDAVVGGAGYDLVRAQMGNVQIGLRSVATVEEISAAGHVGVTISGGANADTLNFSTVALTGIARVNGGLGNDTITGNGDDNVISGDGGDDTLIGGAGADRFQFAGTADGFDAITGGDGIDRVEATADGTVIGLRSIATVEEISASIFANVSILGSANADSLNFAGVTLTGITGIDGGAGNDTLDFSTAILAHTTPISGGAGNDTIRGSAAGDQLFGDADTDTLYGQGGNDLLVGGLGNDTIDGGDGDDVVEFGASDGFDAVVGGAGYDLIRAQADNAVIGLRSVASVEEISAAGHASVTISGSSSADVLDFSAVALSGITRVSGGASNDTITGSAGDDVISGDAGDDTLNGGAGADRFQFSGTAGGFDAIIGGDGNDRIEATADGTVIGLRSIASVEEISANGFANVSVAGSANADTFDFSAMTLTGIALIDGGAGNDAITGNADDNVISGGAGDDTLNGGAGADRFQFSGTNTGYDAVTGGDGIDRIEALADGTSIGLRSLASVEQISANGFANVKIWGSAAADTLDFSAVTLTGIASIDGGAGDDIITGSEGDDVIAAASGTDVLNGGAGNDVFRVGGGGYHSITGGAGLDRLVAASNVVSVAAIGGIEEIDGNGIANVSIVGSAADNVFDFSSVAITGIALINGGAGNDTIVGSAGNDTIMGGVGSDILAGGAGIDTVSYANGTAGVAVNLGLSTQSGGEAQGDQLSGFENIIGTSYADILTGDTGDNVLTGGAGVDSLYGGAGNDTLIGGAGADSLFGDDGIDTVSYAASTAAVRVNLGTGVNSGGDAQGDTLTTVENIIGSAYADTIIGEANGNLLDGGAGADSLDGGAGNDILLGGAGADVLNGGTEIDTASYATAAAGVTVSLATPAQNTGEAAGDVFTSIENLTGSNYNDTLRGDAGANVLEGGAGNDTLSGAAGDDTFVFHGGFGRDTITDFSAGPDVGDAIQVDTSMFADFDAILSSASQIGADTVIALDSLNAITLSGIALSSLTVDDFRFV